MHPFLLKQTRNLTRVSAKAFEKYMRNSGSMQARILKLRILKFPLRLGPPLQYSFRGLFPAANAIGNAYSGIPVAHKV